MLYGYIICLWCICIIQVAYLLWYCKAGKRLALQPSIPSLSPRPISIVICARNEAGNLQRNLPLICTQDYPASLFEVLVVNDGSTDATPEVLEQLREQYPVLRVVSHTPGQHFTGKKAALDFGIRQARYGHILLTDADCRPAGRNWLRSMSSFEPGSVVLGYGPYIPENTLLNKWVRWETLHTFIQYSTYALSGRSYMGVGRNMLYSRQHYLDAVADAGFLSTYNRLPSGDDDLLIQQLTAKGCQVAVNPDPESFMYSPAPASRPSLFRQKSRHVSTGKYYRPSSKYLLGLYGLTHSCFWLSLPAGTALLLTGSYGPAVFLLLLLPVTARLLLLRRAFKIYNTFTQTFDNNRFFIAGDFLWLCYNILLSPFIFYKNKQQWK